PREISFSENSEDLYFWIENKLIENLGQDIAGRLHTGRSRNDINITLFRLNLKDNLIELRSNLLEFLNIILCRIEENIDIPWIAFTHGQPAQPTTFGHYLAAQAEVLLRDSKRFLDSTEDVDSSPMGAAAITTTGFKLNRNRIASLLGLSDILSNSYDAIAGADYLLASLNDMRLLSINLGRFVQNLEYFTGQAVDLLKIPDGFVQQSSIMPNKRNPVVIEHLRTLLSLASGRATGSFNLLHNTPYADINDAEEQLQEEVNGTFVYLKRAINLLKPLYQGIEPKVDNVKSLIDKSFAVITELADSLVRIEDISFRVAHEISAELVNKLHKNNRNLSTLKLKELNEVFYYKIGRNSTLEVEDLDKVLSTEYFIDIRDRPGGPARKSIQTSIKSYKDKYKKLYNKLENEKEFIINREKELELLIKSMLG
ncbi:MAG: argininosuccinate lyase, partial [Halanaerobiales bacterium]